MCVGWRGGWEKGGEALGGRRFVSYLVKSKVAVTVSYKEPSITTSES